MHEDFIYFIMPSRSTAYLPPYLKQPFMYVEIGLHKGC